MVKKKKFNDNKKKLSAVKTQCHCIFKRELVIGRESGGEGDWRQEGTGSTVLRSAAEVCCTRRL